MRMTNHRRICPRCGEGTFERLKTYAHCYGCFHIEDYEMSKHENRFYYKQIL